ncbi:MAG: hypothetical protein KDD46_08440, partial [Bdellovibrionales bacterium]|nr:hypothetical protein [Bdellovibrionales bacterium]
FSATLQGWSYLGTPIGNGERVRFQYRVVTGQTDATGSEIQINAVPGDPTINVMSVQNFAWAEGREGGGNCDLFRASNVVSAAGKTSYHWALIVAASNMYESGDAFDNCTRVIRLIDHQNDQFQESPNIVIPEAD